MYVGMVTRENLTTVYKRNVQKLWASFTNSVCQRKPSFGIKIVLSGFNKDAQWRFSAEMAWTQLFLHLTLLNMRLLEFPFQTQKLWEESIQMNHATRFTNVCACQITGICAII